MNRRQHILHTTMALAAGLMMLSCSHDSVPDNPAAPQQPGTMAIAISLEGSTRADGADSQYEAGTELENTLGLENGYKIMFFTAGGADNGGGTYIASFNANYYPRQLRPDGSYYYNLIGSFPIGLPSKFKIVVLANWPSYPSDAVADGCLHLVKGETTIKDVTTDVSAQFNYAESIDDWIDDDHLIPFYGVREYDLTGTDCVGADGKVKDDAYINLTGSEMSLPLLRALAKVEVILENDLMTFETVTIDRYNDKGYCAPHGDADWNYNHSDYDHGGIWDLDYSKEVHLVGKANDAAVKTSPISFKKYEATATSKERWVAYIPEYRNVGNVDPDDYCSITVSVSTPDGLDPQVFSRKIYFATDGSKDANDKISAATVTESGRYNIERNNIYRFKVTNKGGGPTGLDVSLDVQPFSKVDYNYVVGILRDERGDIIIREVNENNSYYDKLMSAYWDELKDVFIKYPELIPRTGEYVGDEFYYGSWSDRGECSKSEIMQSMISNSFLEEEYMDVELNNRYMDLKHLLKDENDQPSWKLNFETTADKRLDDYYAIVLPSVGLVRASEIWIKDKDGCRVMSNFEANIIDDNPEIGYDAGCSARKVRDFGYNPPIDYYKDKDGYRRLQHNNDHSSIVMNDSEVILFKTAIRNDDNSISNGPTYLVEKWDEYNEKEKTGGDFWYLISIKPAVDNGWSEDNQTGYVTLTYQYGNVEGRVQKDSDGNDLAPRYEETKPVKFSELSEIEKEYFLNPDKGVE